MPAISCQIGIMAPVIILYTVTVPELIVVEASLSFLGFGIPPVSRAMDEEPIGGSHGEVCSEADLGAPTCSKPHGWLSGQYGWRE